MLTRHWVEKVAMRLDFTNERVLAVVAHPDDAEYSCAGTLARAKADGAAIGICVLCRGDKGQPSQTIDDLTAVRRREMQSAADLLGADFYPGESGDGDLADDLDRRRRLVEVYRRFRPTLVLAHAPTDYHSDHRAASAIAEAAAWYCSSHGHVTQSPVLETQPAVWWMDTMNMCDFEPHFYIDVSDYFDLKRRLLACHASQLQRSEDGSFSPLDSQMVRQLQMRGAQAGVAAAEAFRIHRAWKRLRAW